MTPNSKEVKFIMLFFIICLLVFGSVMLNQRSLDTAATEEMPTPIPLQMFLGGGTATPGPQPGKVIEVQFATFTPMPQQ